MEKPSAFQVETYAKSIDFKLDGEEFVDFYKEVDIVDWRAEVRAWKRKKPALK